MAEREIEEKRKAIAASTEKLVYQETNRSQEFNPLEGVSKHWSQSQKSFSLLRQQFPDIKSTVNFMIRAGKEGGSSFSESMDKYRKNVLDKVMDNPDDVRYLALSGVITNLLECGAYNKQIKKNFPQPTSHYDYYNGEEVRAKLIPCLYTTDIIVRSLGLAEIESDSPFNELKSLVTRKDN